MLELLCIESEISIEPGYNVQCLNYININMCILSVILQPIRFIIYIYNVLPKIRQRG